MFRFKITYSGIDTTVIEPRGWSTFKSEIKRDFNSHGVIFKYTSGTLKLGFSDGRDIFETAFRNDGFDAVVVLTVDQRDTDSDTWVTVFTGNAVMKNRELDEDYFNVDFETSTFQQKVINRLDTKVNINALADLDGNQLSGTLTEQSSLWNSIRLNSSFIADYRTGADISSFQTFSGLKTVSGSSGNSVYVYSLMNYKGVTYDDLSGANTIETEDIINTLPTIAAEQQNFIVPISGTLTFTYSLKFQLSATIEFLDEGLSVTGGIGYYLRLRREDTDGNYISSTLLGSDFASGLDPFTHNFGIVTETGSSSISVSEGDNLYYYLEIYGRGDSAVTAPYTVRLDPIDLNIYHSSTVEYTILKSKTTTTVKSYLIHDVIERVLYIISGTRFLLNSDFLGGVDTGYSSDGCGAKTLITNGGKIRGITTIPVNISLEELLSSVMAIWGLGWGFENTGSLYKLRIELMEHFYQDAEIMDLGSPISIKKGGSYKEKVSSDLMINKVTVGFNKFSNDEDYNNNIEDFLTSSEYSLPIETIKGDYSQVSKLIASGRLIQATFEATDLTKRWKYDNNNFIVSAVKPASTYIPENDSAWSSVSGLDDKTTAYNIRFAPVYLMLNHALIINSALKGKALNRVIPNTSAEINLAFGATFSGSEPCLMGDIQNLARTSTGNITIANNYAGLRLFEPIEHIFTVALSSSQLDTIIDSMENNGSDNYGYLTYRDSSGNVQQGYLLSIVWNPNDEIAEITTLEKADNYGI